MSAHGDMRTPLSRVRGLGSARAGTTHFWHQRLTSVAGISLTVAFIVIVISVMGRNHAAVVQILGSPLVAIVMLLFIGSVTYHMRLGMQVIIEDYVHADLPKFALLIANWIFSWAVGLTAAFAVLKIAFGA